MEYSIIVDTITKILNQLKQQHLLTDHDLHKNFKIRFFVNGPLNHPQAYLIGETWDDSIDLIHFDVNNQIMQYPEYISLSGDITYKTEKIPNNTLKELKSIININDNKLSYCNGKTEDKIAKEVLINN